MHFMKIIPFAPSRAFRANCRCLFTPLGPKFTTGRKWNRETRDEKGVEIGWRGKNRKFASLTLSVFPKLVRVGRFALTYVRASAITQVCAATR
jgi:hypothetical protein